MAFAIKGELHGIEGVVANLQALKLGIKNRISKKALTKAAQPVYKDARSRVPVRTKQYRRSLFYRVWVSKGEGGQVLAFIGPRMGFKSTFHGRNVDPVYYAHLVERGRIAVSASGGRALAWPGKDGDWQFARQVKAVAGLHPLERAFDAQQSQAETTITNTVIEEIGKEAAKLAARQAKKG